MVNAARSAPYNVADYIDSEEDVRAGRPVLARCGLGPHLHRVTR